VPEAGSLVAAERRYAGVENQEGHQTHSYQQPQGG
jgi:hypothetical protein